jgi:hypothetical protein
MSGSGAKASGAVFDSVIIGFDLVLLFLFF